MKTISVIGNKHKSRRKVGLQTTTLYQFRAPKCKNSCHAQEICLDMVYVFNR